ncbi:hypothetical protein A2U01_0069004, partial [Trifolium medium]|nr:hypothetical protein [Trifolium medium]
IKLNHPLDQGLLAQRACQRASLVAVAFSRCSQELSVSCSSVAFSRCSEEISVGRHFLSLQRATFRFPVR